MVRRVGSHLPCLDVQLAASARIACTAMYSPGTLNVSNIISAVNSRFSGGFSGGSVSRKKWSSGSHRRYLKMDRCHMRSIRSQLSMRPCLMG